MKLGMSLFAAGALALGTAAMSASATTFVEDAAFGADPPVGAQEWNGAAGFSSVYDVYGRTVALAEPIADSTIDEISLRLWTNDADLWQINVTDAANFSAQISSGSGHSLILFDAAGNALAGVLGNDANSLIDSSWLSGNGTYYLGIGADGSNPRNAAGQNIFALTGTASGPVAGDTALAADPYDAWELNNSANGQLIGPGNFTRPGGGTIRVHLPEPASAALLGLGGLAMLRRR